MREVWRWVGVALLYWVALGVQAQGAVIRLGQSLPLTGALAELGTEYRDGMLAHFKQLNAKGGIHGRKVELTTLDDGYVVERSVENTRACAYCT